MYPSMMTHERPMKSKGWSMRPPAVVCPIGLKLGPDSRGPSSAFYGIRVVLNNAPSRGKNDYFIYYVTFVWLSHLLPFSYGRSITLRLTAMSTMDRPSAFWRVWSSMTMFEIGALSRAFLLATRTAELNGLESFVQLLDSRRDPSKRTRGLVTGMYTIE